MPEPFHPSIDDAAPSLGGGSLLSRMLANASPTSVRPPVYDPSASFTTSTSLATAAPFRVQAAPRRAKPKRNAAGPVQFGPLMTKPGALLAGLTTSVDLVSPRLTIKPRLSLSAENMLVDRRLKGTLSGLRSQLATRPAPSGRIRSSMGRESAPGQTGRATMRTAT